MPSSRSSAAASSTVLLPSVARAVRQTVSGLPTIPVNPFAPVKTVPDPRRRRAKRRFRPVNVYDLEAGYQEYAHEATILEQSADLSHLFWLFRDRTEAWLTVPWEAQSEAVLYMPGPEYSWDFIDRQAGALMELYVVQYQALTPAQQETCAALALNWEGTVANLLSTVRRLT